MRVSVNPCLDMETFILSCERSYEYCGPIWGFKGDNTAQAAEVSQGAFNQQLMNIFTNQYGKQSSIINFLTGKMQPLINAGGQGYSPAALAAQRTSATDTIATQYKNAQAGVNAAAARTGGSALPSGVSTMIESSLAPQEAEAQSQAQNAITTNNANLKNENYWNAISVLNGQSAALNPLGYSSGATAGTGAVANTSQAVTQANGPGVGQILGGIVSGGLQGWATGGFKV